MANQFPRPQLQPKGRLGQRNLSLGIATVGVLLAGIFIFQPLTEPENLKPDFNQTEVYEIAPNPIRKGKLKLALVSDRMLVANLRVIDMMGQIVLAQSQPLEAGQQKLSISLNHLLPGHYILQCRIADKAYNRRFVIE